VRAAPTMTMGSLAAAVVAVELMASPGFLNE
jgi:hypothetical protein